MPASHPVFPVSSPTAKIVLALELSRTLQFTVQASTVGMDFLAGADGGKKKKKKKPKKKAPKMVTDRFGNSVEVGSATDPEVYALREAKKKAREDRDAAAAAEAASAAATHSTGAGGGAGGPADAETTEPADDAAAAAAAALDKEKMTAAVSALEEK